MSYLVLGGCGFIGRHLVSHLLDKNLAEKIVVADKVNSIAFSVEL